MQKRRAGRKQRLPACRVFSCQRQDHRELRSDHHAADPAGKSGHYRFGHERHILAEPKETEDQHHNGGHYRNLGGAAYALRAHRYKDKRNGDGRRPPDHHRIAAEQHAQRRGEDGSEYSQHGRQSHSRRHSQAVGKRDERSDEASAEIAAECVPAVLPGPASEKFYANHVFVWNPLDCLASYQAMTFTTACLNFAISCSVPRVILLQVGIEGHTRPTKTFSRAMAATNSAAGRLASSMKQLLSDGMKPIFFCERQEKTSSRTERMSLRRSGTTDFERRLAVAPTMPVTGRAPAA